MSAHLIEQETRLEPITAVQPHPANPRRGATPAIIESIRANGFYGSVIAQRSTGYILAGSHRHAAAIAAGLEQIPVTWVQVDDEQAKRIMLADNRTSDLGAYDEPALAELLQAAHDLGDLTGTGYTEADLTDLLEHLTPYRPPEPPKPPKAGTKVAAEQVDKARTRLAEHYQTERDLHTAMCPNCGHEFYTD